MAAVAGVLGLLGATLWWLRSRGLVALGPRGGGRVRQLEAVERLALSPQHTLHVVRYGGRRLLVAASPAGCAVLEAGPEDGR
jgi:hypothetical protein